MTLFLSELRLIGNFLWQNPIFNVIFICINTFNTRSILVMEVHVLKVTLKQLLRVRSSHTFFHSVLILHIDALDIHQLLFIHVVLLLLQ